ncbi:hypothetical protein GXM_06733 [Nostoc sphaeroides CCNUC1]|uniref:Uncharacterized protein n=1 Tax=Nostoc sphaeroides CCNUC1 TaxID=2653204 RepID=A0A5P8WBG7_9NOSO|nr:hypothetical protein GXM_06733 [Nostoc sphaeroides CCNUC1]
MKNCSTQRLFLVSPKEQMANYSISFAVEVLAVFSTHT